MKLFISSALFGPALLGMLVQSTPCQPVSDSRWESLPPITMYPRQEHTTLALNSTTLAILGGIIPNASAPIGFTTVPFFQAYHLPSDGNANTNSHRNGTWLPTLLSPAPLALNHPNAAVIPSQGKLYLLGGMSDSGDGVWRGTGASFVYDISANTWAPLPPMPDWDTPRGSAAVGVDEDRGIIYLAGGLTQLPLVPPYGPQTSVDVVSAFDTRRGRWVPLLSGAEAAGVGPDKGKNGSLTSGSAGEAWRTLPGRRDHAGTAVVGGVMYVLGGRDTGVENVRGDVFALDLRRVEEGWVTKKDKMPTPRGGVCSGAVGGKVYVFGGEGNPDADSNGVWPQVEAYDTRKDSWERLANMSVPRHGTSATTVGGGVYIPGGGIKEAGAPVDTFNVFYP